MKKNVVLIDRDKLKQAADVARLVDHVYHIHDPLPAGWHMAADSTAVVPLKTGFFAALYENDNPVPGQARHIVAFRGVNGFEDLSSIFSIFTCRIPRQFGLAQDFMKYLADEKKLEVSEIELAGHSLGGYLASTVGHTAGAKKVWAYNSPGPTKAMREKLAKDMPSRLPQECMIHIRSQNDVISQWGYEDGIAITLDTKYNHHALKTLQVEIAKILRQKTDAVRPVEKGLTLNAIFNGLSCRVCKSSAVKKFIHTIFAGPPPRGGDMPKRA